MEIKIKKSTFIIFTAGIILLIMSGLLLGSDCIVFLKWWLMALFIGIGFMPLSAKVFSCFSDGGWIFSKVIGILFSGYLCWLIVMSGFAGFETGLVVICTLTLIVLIWTLYITISKKKDKISIQNILQKQTKSINWQLVIFEEVLFIGMFLLWTYIAGFRPEAYGTEKFMDFGFMAAMMRDSALPAQDMWFSGEPINYYYGGHYYAVFLTRLTGCDIAHTYNVMRTFVASLAFVMPFSLIWQLITDRHGTISACSNKLAIIGGVIAGAAVSLAGNMHYVIYGLLGKVLKPTGYESYWFSSSTRVIGYSPKQTDPCIHEFPSFSLLLGDLHAHVVNIYFVLLFIAVLYSMLSEYDKKYRDSEALSDLSDVILQALKDKYIWLLGLLIGIFQFTNHWDFIIYLTVAAFTLLILVFRDNGKKGILLAGWLFKTAMLIAVCELFALPFTLSYKSIFMGVGLVRERSMFYQLIILWGLPVASVLTFLIWTIVHTKKSGHKCPFIGYVTNLSLSDMFVLILGICAIGLVIIPELFYVIDIYDNGTSRCNTMFKLTYQAFIMFGITFGYVVIRLIADSKKKYWHVVAGVITTLLLLTCLYFPYGVSVWSGDISNHNGYKGLDATAYLQEKFAEDAGAICWIKENVKGNAVVLEATGEGFTDCCRVSAMTGTATPLGWVTHEYLWRNDEFICWTRLKDVDKLYTGSDEKEVKKLIDKYEIGYIFVGNQERKIYGTKLNEDLLNSLGEIVFRGDKGKSPTYIIKTGEMQ